jgi:hypothetical protein
MKVTWRTPHLPLGKHARIAVSVGLRLVVGAALGKADYLPVYGLNVCVGPFTVNLEWKKKHNPFWR